MPTQMLKLGRLPRRKDSRRLQLKNYLPVALPPPPVAVDWGSKVPAWGMCMNDTLGNCVIEGTQVEACGVKNAYRAKYDGPVVKILTESGKSLTVTPNHAILSKTGFITAANVKQGDYLVSTSGAEIFPWSSLGCSERDINYPPTKIEEIFSSFSLIRNSVREVMPVSIDFHGDEKFINGNVKIVSSNSFLGGELNTLLRKPNTKNQISAAGKLKGRLHSLGASLKGNLVSIRSSFCDIGFSAKGLPLELCHAGISQSNGLTKSSGNKTSFNDGFFKSFITNSKIFTGLFHGSAGHVFGNGSRQIPEFFGKKKRSGSTRGSQFEASGSQPSSNSSPTDPCLSGNLISRLPGIVSNDRVVSIKRDWYHGFVYDLSCGLQWYLSSGIVTHNCTAAAAAHAEMLWTANSATEYLPTDADVLTFYECVSGYDPSDPSTDTGANMLDVLNYWRQVGFNGRKITAFAEVDNDPMDIKNAIALFGCIYCGVNLPQSAMTDFENGQAWMNIHDKSNIGGHCILESAYNAQGLTSVTWGKSQPTTWPWFKKFCDERYVIITPEWIAENGNSPSGFNFAQLQADLAAFE